MNKLIVLLVFISVSCNYTFKNKSNQDFEKTIADIKEMELDFKIEFGDYDYLFDRDSDGNINKNPLFKPITGALTNYIRKDYPVDGKHEYYWILKRNMQDKYLVAMSQLNFTDNEFWIYINLYSDKGELLDTLKFSGEKICSYKMYGKIDKRLQITTRSYHDIVIDTTFDAGSYSPYFATEISKTYLLEGTSFKMLEQKNERVRFINLICEEKEVITRMDTLENYSLF